MADDAELIVSTYVHHDLNSVTPFLSGLEGATSSDYNPRYIDDLNDVGYRFSIASFSESLSGDQVDELRRHSTIVTQATLDINDVFCHSFAF